MLKLLRRSVKSLVAKILLVLLIASFAVWGIGDIFTARTDLAVATAGETEVSGERFANALIRTQRLLAQQQREAITLQTLREMGFAEAALAGLVRDAAYAEELDRLEIAIPPEAVRDAILANPAFQDGQGAFSQFLYQSRLNELGYDPQMFETATAELLGQQILADAVAPGLVPPPGAGEAIAAHRGERRAVSAARLSPEDAPDPGLPDEAALAAYFEANAERFVEPERRWGAYIRTDLAKLAQEMTPSAEDVRAEYEANLQRYRIEPTREVEQIVFDDEVAARAAAERLAAGSATFAEIAAEQNLSVADLSLGTVTREDLPEASAEAVFGATTPGVVGPVEGAFGPVLLNVTSVVEGGTRPFEEVAGEISRQIARRRAVEEALDRANAIDDARAAGASLPEVAESVGLDLVRFEGIGPRGTVAEGDPPPLATDPEFLAEVGDAVEDEERDLVQLADGSYVLVMVDRIVESHMPELDAVRDRVVAAWQQEQRLQAQEARAAELAGRVGAEADLQAVATQAGLDPPISEDFTRETVPASMAPALADAIFAAEQGDTVVGRTRDGEAVLLVLVDEVTPLEDDQLAERGAAIDEALAASLSDDVQEYFGRAVEARHGASVDRAAIEQVFDQLGQVGRR